MNILRLLEGIRTPAGEIFFQGVTYLGQEFMILGLISVLYWCVHKDLACRVMMSFSLSGLVLNNAKLAFRINRPWILDPQFHPVASAVPAAGGYSFPSGHSQGAGSVYFILAMFYKNKILKVIFTVLPFLVAFSRMYLGVHTPKDVSAALLIAAAVAFLVWKWYERAQRTEKEDLQLMVFFAAAAVLTVVFALYQMKANGVTAEMADGNFKLAGAAVGCTAGMWFEHRYVNFSVEGSMTGKILRLLAGLASAFLIKIIIGSVCGKGVSGCIIEYALVVFWMIGGYPWIFSRLEKRKRV